MLLNDFISKFYSLICSNKFFFRIYFTDGNFFKFSYSEFCDFVNDNFDLYVCSFSIDFDLKYIDFVFA